MERPHRRGMMANSFGIDRALRLTRPPPGIFCKSYHCHSMACLDREGLEFGDKIIMPQAAFQEAHRLRLKLPLLFKVVNADVNTRRILGTAGPVPCQFCGVLEFSAPDNQVFLPYWMMQSLLLVEGARVELRSILRPPAGSFVRFKPHDDTFLELAARQGPKALMEGALRRYSVLSEGATVLVQHEGENFYLDVAEVRTFATCPGAPIGDNCASSSNSPRELTHAERRGRHSGDDVRDNRDGTSNIDDDCDSSRVGGGKQVRLVCLLGDLDLEVEFCAPHAPLPKQGAAEHSLDRRTERHREGIQALHVDRKYRDPKGPESRSSMNESSPSPSGSPSSSRAVAVLQASAPLSAIDGAACPIGDQLEQPRLAWPLPAPARARRSDGGDSASGLGTEKPRRRTGQLGIKPPVLPSKIATCRAFSGKGVSLLGDMAGSPPTGEIAKSTGTMRTNCDQLGRLPRSATLAASATHSFATRGNVGLAETGAQLVPGDVDADWPVGAGRVGEGSKGSGQRRLPGNDDGGAVGNAPSSVPETGTASAARGRLLGEGTPSVTSVTQARGRSCGSPGGTDAAEAAQVDSRADAIACGRCGKLVPTANLRLHELRCGSSSTVVQQQHPPHDPPTESCTKLNQPVSVASSARCTEPNAAAPAPAKPSTAAAASAAEFPCAYCGLIFSSAGPAGEHEEVCGTRTERCDRCCSHVPRRDGESHRRPGGGCDAVIASAEDHEKQVLTAGRSLGLFGSSGGDSGGGGGGGSSGIIGGRFDALLAEAVRSSKAASTALADARAENDARMLEPVRPAPPPGGRGLLRSSGHGRDNSKNDCSGKPYEAVVDAAGGAPKGGAGGMGTTITGALENGCGSSGMGSTGGNRGSPNCTRESGTNRHSGAPRVIVASNDAASFSAKSRVITPDPSSPSTPATAHCHNDMKVSDNGGESISYELSSPQPSGRKEGAGSSASRSWACPRCTLINPRGSTSCEACGSVPRSAAAALEETVSGGRQPSTNPSEHDPPTTDSEAAKAIVEDPPAGMSPGAAEGDVRESSSGHTVTADTGAAVQSAGEARTPTGDPPRRRQTTTTPVPLWAATAAFPPDSSPPPGRKSPSKERRTHAVRLSPPPAPSLLLSPPAVRSSEYTRASGSAPQPCRGTSPTVTGSSSGALGRDDAGHLQPLRTRHTAPASSNVPSATDTREGLVEGTAAGVAGPRARYLRSPATFVPADIHPPQPRGRRKEAPVPQGVRVVRQKKQHYKHATQQGSRRSEKQYKLAERRRLMGPPRRLGGIYRTSRLRHAPPPSSRVTPPIDTTTTAARVVASISGSRSERRVGPRHDHRHSRDQSRESLGSSRPDLQGGLGSSVGRRGTTVSAAPACDVSLSILGRSQAHGGTLRGAQASRGGRVSIGGGAEAGEGSRPPGQESESVAFFKQEVGGGIGNWGRRFGGREGGGGVVAAAAVGVAPLKLRRRVSDTRVLAPLVAR